jgi:peroxiredoxin Q/BCP
MSKKTRKKSSKLPVGKSSKTASRTAAKKPAKASKTSATKSPKPTKKPSHKTPSKTLKRPRAEKPATTAATPKTVAAKTTVAKPPSRKAASERPTPPAPTGLPLAEGQKAPQFQLPRDGGGSVSLADFSGRNLVIFFYPRADTPGCTREAIDFSRLSKAFAESQTAVLGVSADPLKAQEAFRSKHDLTMPLASDETHEMLEAYGVWGEKSMYGRTFQGVLRTTVLIGKSGKIARIWRGVKVDGHADEVLGAVRSL